MTAESMSEVNGWFCVVAGDNRYNLRGSPSAQIPSYRACHGIQMFG